MAKKVYQKAVRDGTVEMKSVFFELMLNVMMMMIAGKRYYGDSVADVEEGRRFKEIVMETFVVMETTNVSDYLPWWKWVGGRRLEKKMVALKEKRNGFMQGLLEELRRKMAVVAEGGRSEEKKSLIEVLLILQETEPENYKDEVIKGLMQVYLIIIFIFILLLLLLLLRQINEHTIIRVLINIKARELFKRKSK